MNLLQNKNCSKCAIRFECGLQTGDCWCDRLPHIPLIAGGEQDCLCPRCLSEVIQNAERAATLPDEHLQPITEKSQKTHYLQVGEDYYLEGGALVFTARYHLRRGYCCENGCRHCPYA